LDELDWQLEQLRRVLPRYTHLLADAFLPVFGGLNGTDVAADLPTLAHAGIDVAMLAHGSEVRDPRRHREASPFSLFHHAPPELVETLTRASERNREIAATAGRPLFVTTPDLLADLPTARWVPLVVDVEAWRCDRPVLERARPVVLHAPSTRWTKGTDLFLPDLERLHERGLVELRLVEGLEWSEMRAQVWDADIVVDQVAVGSYGAFACEAMAAGKPVVVHLADDVVAAIGERPPVVDTAPNQVGRTISDLLDDREAAAATGRAAADYARRVHGGQRSADVLREWLGA
ncbi:MAG: hypothetical protein JWM84_3596, partial [Nocardioides sp.]|nr:hypothetical protein [Nocardioides sp.]